VRGSELLKQGKLDDAQKVFRAALALDTDNSRVLALLGLSHFRAGQFGDARPIYEQLVERTPTDASHRLNLGLVYLKLGDSDRAISALEASRALDPSQGRAVSYLGLAYARSGRYAEAYRAFLLAGQNDLASEIEINLTQVERDNIHAQLQRSGLEPAIPRTRTPPPRPPPKPPSQDDIITQPIRPIEVVTTQSAAVIHVPAPEPEPEPSASMEIFVERHADAPPPPRAPVPAATPPPSPVAIAPAHELQAPRMTDSLQFVLPSRDAIPLPADGQSMISQAVDQASPSQAGVTGARVGAGSAPPLALSQLATDELVRPDDGDQPFEVSASGALVVRITERVMTRLEGVHVTGGDLAFEPAMRRSRGHQTDDKFDYGGAPLHSVSGRGYLIALPGDRVFAAVTLDDDIFYLREDLVFAFQASLRWENGNVPGLRGRFPVVQFRGDGSVALRSGKPLVRVKLPAQGVMFVDVTRLAGWIGRVIPRAVVPPAGGPMGEVCVECTGEGVVLVDPVGDQASGVRPQASGSEIRTKAPSKPPSSPPPAKPAEAKLDLGDDEF